MRSPLVRSILLAPLGAALLGLAACGHDGGPSGPGDPQDTLPRPVIDSARTLEFAGTTNQLMQLVTHVVYSGQDLGTPNPFHFPNFAPPIAGAGSGFSAVAAIAACTPVQTGVDTDGVAIDSDLDGIPDDNTVDFGPGCSFLDGGVEYTWSGKYRLRDPNTGIMDWEYTTTALAAKARDTLTGDLYRQEVTGMETAHFTPGVATHQMDVTLEVNSRSGGDSGHVTLRTDEASTFTPTAPFTFMTGGSRPPGSLDFNVALTFRDFMVAADSQRFVISTPTPIHSSADCITGIDAGEMRGLFEGDARVGFRFTWPGCGDPVFEVFGTTP